MGLTLLIAMVVVGISAVVFAVHRTGGSTTAVLTDADHARRRFAEDFPGETADTVMLTTDAGTAFLLLEAERTGVVQSFGDRFLTRIVKPYDVVEVRRDDAMISVRFRDFTWTGGEFLFADADEAGQVEAALGAGRDMHAKGRG